MAQQQQQQQLQQQLLLSHTCTKDHTSTSWILNCDELAKHGLLKAVEWLLLPLLKPSSSQMANPLHAHKQLEIRTPITASHDGLPAAAHH